MKPKCEICGKVIKGVGCYLQAKLLCKKCFYKNKYSKRMPRNPNYFDKAGGF